jgi:hypothetical protein
MVGDDHDRSDGRDAAQTLGIVMDPQPKLAYRRRPEALTRPWPALMVEIKALQSGLPGQALDGADPIRLKAGSSALA